MTLVRILLADLCWRAAGGLTLFVSATLLGRRSLPRIPSGRRAASGKPGRKET